MHSHLSAICSKEYFIMNKKMYVGNISYNSSEDSLKDLFGNYGTVVSVKIITDRETNRSRGFGFVEMSTEDEAQACIDQLNGKEVDGRNLNISEAKERAPRQRSF